MALVRELSKKRAPAGISSTGGSHRGYYDGFGRRLSPSKLRLVNEYKRTVYTCANLNSYGVTNTPLKLYMKTSSGDTKSVLRKGIELKGVSGKQKAYLSKLPYLSKTLRSSLEIEEVVQHPILDLLEKGNETRYMNGEKLMALSVVYMDICGEAYWK